MTYKLPQIPNRHPFVEQGYRVNNKPSYVASGILGILLTIYASLNSLNEKSNQTNKNNFNKAIHQQEANQEEGTIETNSDLEPVFDPFLEEEKSTQNFIKFSDIEKLKQTDESKNPKPKKSVQKHIHLQL